MIRKLISVLYLFLLVGCSIEEAATDTPEQTMTIPENTSFILRAADGFVSHSNYETPHTYIVDVKRNEVYVDKNLEPSGLTPAEIIEQAQKNPIEREQPIFEMNLLNIEDDTIRLGYESESVEFTALSKSYYKDQDGIQYIIEPYDSGIDGYIRSLREQ